MPARAIAINYLDPEHVSDLTVTPAAASGYPITNLQSDVSADTWRSPNLDSQVLTWSYGGNARRVSGWGIFPGRGVASLLGVQARQRFFADAARATQTYDSGFVDAFTFNGTGWGSFPLGAHKWGVARDYHHARRAPLVRWIPAVTAGAGELTIRNAGAVDTSYFEASRIVVGDYLEAPYNALNGCTAGWVPRSSSERTYGGSWRRDRREPFRVLRCEIALLTEADRAAWFSFCYAAEGREILFSLFQSGHGQRREHDFTVLGTLTVINPVVFENANLHKLRIEIEEG